MNRQEEKKIPRMENKEISEERLIRILATDIPGNKNLYAGLTRIKGISWSFSNAICNSLKMEKTRKIESLSKEEIEKITNFIKSYKVPLFLLNRKFDREDGTNKHLIGADLDMQKEFDIKRFKKIRSYKGLRHALGQPVRGQRTKSHFRKNKTIGVMKKAKGAK